MNDTRQKLNLLMILGVACSALYGVNWLNKRNETDSCQSNLKKIGLGMLQYVRDYDEKNVLADRWETLLIPYVKNLGFFKCPSSNRYAFNRYLAGASHVSISPSAAIPTFFDSTSTQTNTSNFGTSYPAIGAHALWRRGRGTNVLFYDGHVKWMQQKPAFQAIKPLPTPIVIRELPVKRDSKGRVIIKIERTTPR